LKQNSDESNDFKTLSQLGQNYQAKRQLQKALAYSKKAYELVKTEADSDDLIVALVNMGAIYWDMSQLRKATKFFQDSLLIVERTQLVPPWKYEILQVVMVRGIATLKNRIQIARNQHDSVRILLPTFSMLPLMLFTGQKEAIPSLLKEIVPLAQELKRNKILDTITALEKIIRV